MQRNNFAVRMNSEIIDQSLTDIFLTRINTLIPSKYITSFSAEYDKLVCEIQDEINLVCDPTVHEGKTKAHSLDLQEKPYRFGKSKHFKKFIRNKRTLIGRLFVSHYLMKTVLSFTVQTMPNLMVEFKSYRDKPIRLVTLEKDVHRDLGNTERFLTQKWYMDIMALIFKEHNKKETGHFKRIIRSVSSFITIQVIKLKIRTIKYILDTLTDDITIPFMKMELKYDGHVTVLPNENEFLTAYKKFLLKIDSIATNMSDPQAWFNMPKDREIIFTHVPEDFLRQSFVELEHIAKKLYTPVDIYVCDIEKEYEEICDTNLLMTVDLLIKNSNKCKNAFQSIFYKACHYQNIRNSLHSKLKNIYFTMGRLNQKFLMDDLRTKTEHCYYKLTEHLTKLHKIEAQRISKVFQDVADKTQTVPTCTEKVMEMVEYLQWTRTILIKELKEKLESSFTKFGILIEMTYIDKNNILLNSKNVQWLERIQTIFQEQHSKIMRYKQEFETILSKKTENLNKSLEDLTPRLVIIELMDEIQNVEQYLPDIRKFLRKLEHFDEEIVWINKEEALFKFPLSTYPELDELKNYIHPFAELLNTIYKWQLTYKVWMECSLDIVEHEEMESKCRDLKRNIEAKLTLYKVKFKQGDDSSKRFQGVSDETDLGNLPAPIKLCMIALKQMDDFESFLKKVQYFFRIPLNTQNRRALLENIGIDINPLMERRLNVLKHLNLSDCIQELSGIFHGAEKDANFSTASCQMFSVWKGRKSACLEIKH